MKYRPEVDGLRALAIIPVILYHAGFSVFSGGFVGVDVFFVISGYLITTIIISEVSEKRFSLVTFYERRARRILPPLFLVIFISIPFAWLWLVPRDLQGFYQSILAILTFSSNFLFWLESGYFEPAAELKPMLHTWSLAVEEQYYILFPLFIMGVWRLGKTSVFALLTVFCICSLLLAQWEVYNNPDRAFYLLHTRGWEILLGSLVGLYLFRDKNIEFKNAINQSLSLIGLCLILYSVFVYDRDTPFPSLFTLVPTFGAALIILFAKPKTLVYKLLSCQILVWVGLLSYSIYLWHQPLMAFAKYRSSSEPTELFMLLLVLLSILLAYLTYLCVEKPFRNKTLISRKLIFSLSGIFAVCLAALSSYVISQDGLKNRYSKQQQDLLTMLEYSYTGNTNYESDCFLQPEQTYLDFTDKCLVNQGANRTFIWGDSHAMALTVGVKNINENISQFTASACAPIYNQVFKPRPHCLGINNHVIDLIAEYEPERVILHAYWLSHIDKIDGMSTTINKIKEVSSSTKIILVGSVPIWLPSLPEVLLTKQFADDERPLYVVNDTLPKISVVDKRLRAIASDNRVQFIAPTKMLCENGACLAILENKDEMQVLAWDYAHLTAEGSNLLASMLYKQIH